jgi:tetratricopeptide (TPR) repeat protein
MQIWLSLLPSPELGRPGPAATHGPHDHRQLFEGVVGLVTALAGRSTVAIVLEDLHWADDMSLRLVSFVARRLARMPVLLVLTAREEELEPASSFHRVVDDLPPELVTPPMALTPLARADTLRLVRALTGSRDATVAERLGEDIWTASEGHPFMVVEMVRAAGDATPPPALVGTALPQRVRRLIEQRLQHLGTAAQQLVATAAVIGRDVPYAWLEQASGLGEDDAVAGLEELVRRRIIHAVGERFEFTHDRIRDVAYTSPLAPRRKLLHRRVAEALQRLGDDDLGERSAALGAHYAEAEVWERAARSLYDAAGSAYERTAYREGGLLLERALAAVTRLPRTRETIGLEIDIRLRLFRCLNPLADPRAGEQVARARALVGDSPDEAREAIILVEVAELRRLGKDLGAAIEAGDRALLLATRTGRPRLMAQAHFQLGVAHVTCGAYDEGIGHLRATVARLADAPLRDRLGYPYVTALCRLTWSFADLGDLAKAERYAEEATRVARDSEHVLTVAETATAVGVLHLARDRPADAIPALQRALELARAWRIAYIRSFSGVWLALAHARCGRVSDAGSLLDECESGRIWEGLRLQWSRIIVRLAEGRGLLGDARRAHALAAEGLALARAIGEPAGAAEALALLAGLALRRKPAGVSEALGHLTEAVALAERLRLRPLGARLQSLVAAAHAGH